MTPWKWWAGIPGDETFDLALEEPTRDAAIASARAQVEPGTEFEIIEARSSTSRKYWESDFVPFVRTRNHERLTA